MNLPFFTGAFSLFSSFFHLRFFKKTTNPHVFFWVPEGIVTLGMLDQGFKAFGLTSDHPMSSMGETTALDEFFTLDLFS